jgi:ketosteroid isomerase-like protein
MRTFDLIGVVLAGVAMPAVVAMTSPARQPPDAGDAAAIRAARTASNAAIAKHDVPGIAAHWTADVHIVTSTSAQGTGKDVNGQRMAQQFARRPDTVYVRTPTTIEVLREWDVASERGDWTGRWTEPDGVVDIGGTYLAQWRRVNGTWLIQAELFVPTRCRGAKYCAARP